MRSAVVTLLGIDPGFAALGLAQVELVGSGERVAELGVVRTAKSNRKRGIRASDDNVRRIIELAQAVEPWVAPDVIAICVESQSWPRSSAVCGKLGMAWGVVGALAARHQLPVLQASPKEIKRAVTGKATASKDAVQTALEARYGPLRLPEQRTLHEHACDALGAVAACLEAPVVLMARRMAFAVEGAR